LAKREIRWKASNTRSSRKASREPSRERREISLTAERERCTALPLDAPHGRGPGGPRRTLGA
jgi:hypothetical protein